MIVTVLDINQRRQVLNVKDIYVTGAGTGMSQGPLTNTSVIARKLQCFMLIDG